MYLLPEFYASQEELIHDVTCRVIPKKKRSSNVNTLKLSTNR